MRKQRSVGTEPHPVTLFVQLDEAAAATCPTFLNEARDCGVGGSGDDTDSSSSGGGGDGGSSDGSNSGGGGGGGSSGVPKRRPMRV